MISKDATFYTGNDALNYVLREKMLLCEEYHISFSCMADRNELSLIRPVDVYAMMGNALDNAIESVLREAKEKRLLSLHIRNYGQMFHFHIENTCNREVQFQEGMPLTDKKDKNVHGCYLDISFYKDKLEKSRLFVAVETLILFVNLLIMGTVFTSLSHAKVNAANVLLIAVMSLWMLFGIISRIFYCLYS